MVPMFKQKQPSQCLLMPEMADSRKDHRYPRVIRSQDDFIVPNRAARLYNGGPTCLDDSQ